MIAPSFVFLLVLVRGVLVVGSVCSEFVGEFVAEAVEKYAV